MRCIEPEFLLPTRVEDKRFRGVHGPAGQNDLISSCSGFLGGTVDSGQRVLRSCPPSAGTSESKSNRGKYMGLITPNDFPNLRELYTAQLRYLLSTENQIVDGLPKMIDHAEEPQLKQAFQSHLQETRVHVQRLQRLLSDLTNEADDKKDPILTAIVGSGENITKETDPGSVREAGLIATAQKVEHYEIASYGSAR